MARKSDSVDQTQAEAHSQVAMLQDGRKSELSSKPRQVNFALFSLTDGAAFATPEAVDDGQPYKLRRMIPSSSYDDTVRKVGGVVAGPGRGHTTQQLIESGQLGRSSTAQLLMMPTSTKGERHLQNALREEVVEHKATRKKLLSVSDQLSMAQSLLLQEVNGTVDPSDPDRQAALQWALGERVDNKDSSFRAKRLAVENFLRQQAPTYMEAIQLCEEMLQRLQKPMDPTMLLSHNEKKKRARALQKESEKEATTAAVRDEVLASISAYLAALRKEHKGRYIRQARVAQQVVQDALCYDVTEEKMRKLVAHFVGESEENMRKATIRVDAMKSACEEKQRPAYYRDKEKSCGAYGPAWAAFVVDMWLRNSRESENKLDQVRSPLTDPVTGKRSTETKAVAKFTMGEKALLAATIAKATTQNCRMSSCYPMMTLR